MKTCVCGYMLASNTRTCTRCGRELTAWWRRGGRAAARAGLVLSAIVCCAAVVLWIRSGRRVDRLDVSGCAVVSRMGEIYVMANPQGSRTPSAVDESNTARWERQWPDAGRWLRPVGLLDDPARWGVRVSNWLLVLMSGAWPGLWILRAAGGSKRRAKRHLAAAGRALDHPERRAATTGIAALAPGRIAPEANRADQTHALALSADFDPMSLPPLVTRSQAIRTPDDLADLLG